jgi:hypothetical protein
MLVYLKDSIIVGGLPEGLFAAEAPELSMRTFGCLACNLE